MTKENRKRLRILIESQYITGEILTERGTYKDTHIRRVKPPQKPEPTQISMYNNLPIRRKPPLQKGAKLICSTCRLKDCNVNNGNNSIIDWIKQNLIKRRNK